MKKHALIGILILALMGFNLLSASAEEPTYVYNPHVILSQYAAVANADELALFTRIADAVEAGETAVDASGIPDEASFMRAYYAYMASNPLSALIELAEFHPETQQVVIAYRYENAALLQRIGDWHTLIQKIITDTVTDPSNPTETARELYRYVAQNTRYGDEYLQDADKTAFDISAYSVLTQGVGICKDYTRAYNFLCMQMGIECLEIETEHTDTDTGHAWSLIRLNGQYYHMDPTFESSNAAYHKDLSLDTSWQEYFGMDDHIRAESLAGPYYIRYGQNAQEINPAPACDKVIDGFPGSDVDDALIGD